MTNVTIPVLLDGKRYDGQEPGQQAGSMPPGVQRWIAQGEHTAVGAGTLQWRLDFNPDSNTSWQPYISVDRVTMDTTVVVLAIPGVGLTANGSGWEDNRTFLNNNFGPFEMIPYGVSTQMQGAMNVPTYLGRMARTGTARMTINVEQVDTTIYRVNVRGWMSQYPYPANWNWRA